MKKPFNFADCNNIFTVDQGNDTIIFYCNLPINHISRHQYDGDDRYLITWRRIN